MLVGRSCALIVGSRGSTSKKVLKDEIVHSEDLSNHFCFNRESGTNGSNSLLGWRNIAKRKLILMSKVEGTSLWCVWRPLMVLSCYHLFLGIHKYSWKCKYYDMSWGKYCNLKKEYQKKEIIFKFIAHIKYLTWLILIKFLFRFFRPQWTFITNFICTFYISTIIIATSTIQRKL